MRQAVALLIVLVATVIGGSTARAQPQPQPLPPIVEPTPAAPAAAEPAPPLAPAAATASRDAARAAFRRGLEPMWAGRWSEALAALEESYAALPTQLALIDAAVCLERMRRNEEATVKLRELQVRFGRALSPERRARVGRSLARLTGSQPSVAVSTSVEGAAIRIDGRDVGRAPLLEPISLSPGPHAIEATHPGRVTVVRQIVLTPTDRREIDLELGPVASR